MGQHRILIIDDHNLFRTGLSMILNQHESIAETHEAGAVMEAVNLSDVSFDLILLDIQLPGLNGLDGIKLLQDRYPNTPVIILSASSDRTEMRKASDQGAMGFLPKSAGADEILEAIESVIGGERCFPEDPNTITNSLMPAETKELTPRQLQVLALICEGKPNKLIARELDMAENTVRVHVSAILNNLGVTSRTEAILAAQKLGIVGTQ